MKLSTKLVLLLIGSIAAAFATGRVAFSHCEIPCGIYGDKTRIDMLYEHVTTIEKSMQQIIALEKDKSNYNQLVRWINNKETHATELQHIVTQYFMTQRVKPSSADATAHAKYLAQLLPLHGMLISAMKAKQTTDVAHCAALRGQIDSFAAAYFNAEDLEHIRSHHADEKK